MNVTLVLWMTRQPQSVGNHKRADLHKKSTTTTTINRHTTFLVPDLQTHFTDLKQPSKFQESLRSCCTLQQEYKEIWRKKIQTADQRSYTEIGYPSLAICKHVLRENTRPRGGTPPCNGLRTLTELPPFAIHHWRNIRALGTPPTSPIGQNCLPS